MGVCCATATSCCGSGVNEQTWYQQLENVELDLLNLSGIPPDQIGRTYTMIKIETKDFAVRTIYIGEFDEYNQKKKTLVMTHGFGSFAMTFFKYLKPLSEKYRIVLFDNCCWGLNTRMQESWSTISVADAEAWFTDWITKTIENLDLPPRFYIAAHAQGNYLMSLYAALKPERVEGFFMLSPTHMETYDKHDYDPYSVRDPKDVSAQFVQRAYVDQILEWEEMPCEERDHPLAVTMPEFFHKRLFRDEAEKMLSTLPGFSLEEVKAYSRYLTLMYDRLSIIDQSQMLTEKFPALGIYDMQGSDRLGNPDIDFPIAMCFGDSDFLGTEGAEQIVKNNKYYESGQSQIFKIRDATHRLDVEKPQEIPALMIDFFEGKVTRYLQLKPKYEIACAPFPKPMKVPMVSKFKQKSMKRQSVFF